MKNLILSMVFVFAGLNMVNASHNIENKIADMRCVENAFYLQSALEEAGEDKEWANIIANDYYEACIQGMD